MNLNYIVECGVSQGLVCLNKQQINRTCLDYEIRILCCTCNNTNDISVADYSKAQSYLSDVRFEDHKESYIIKQQSDSHTSDQIHYPAQPLVTPDNKIDSKIDEPIKELGSSKMQKHNHVTDSAFPLLDANSPIFVIDPVIYTTTPGDGPTEKKDYYPVPSAPLIVTFPPDNDYEYESFPLLEANTPEFVIDPVIKTTTPRGGDGPTEKKDYYPVPSAPLIVTFPPDNTDYEYKMSTSKMKTDKTQKNPQPTNSTDVGKEFS
ncbi:hypothetical protein GDO86_008704 [Hymenochirus boettgeri]|uniref:WxxW domain-containing protein n=1 Tax=Hymenochirus boettgeri TaxID=247094 RepID=A0A8T2J1H0_9PIPI|nr:hypothetical protein GDO86_008704 [Hymenochirus boettgeri]